MSVKRTYNIGEFYFELEDGVVRAWRHGTYPQRTPNAAPIPCCSPCSRIPIDVLSNLLRQINQGPGNIAG